MKKSNRKIEELICDDIALINKVLKSADLQSLYVRRALYDGIREGDVFASPLGEAFLDSLLNDGIYKDPDAADQLLRDMDALRRMMEFRKNNDSVQAAERMRGYRFRSAWVRRFMTRYLEGGMDAAPREDLAELADLERIRKLVRAGQSADGFQYDDTYSLMEKYQEKNLFGSWLGKLFMEMVRVQTTEYKKKRQLKKWLGGIAVACCLFSMGFIFWGLHLREQERVDEQLAQLLREEKDMGLSVENGGTLHGPDGGDGGGTPGGGVSENSEMSGISERPEALETEKTSEGSAAEKTSEGAVAEKTSEESNAAENSEGSEDAKNSETADAGGGTQEPEMLAKYRGLYKQNRDMAGWLEIGGTIINYPVMQKPGQEDYYLTHDFLGAKSQDGLLFIDGSASLSPMDDNIVIYGHNMRSGNMFGSLMFYKSRSHFSNYPVFQFDTLYEERNYQIVAVLLVDTSKEEGFCYYECRDLSDEQTFQNCRDFIREHRLYETGYEIEYGDQLVMLSTCESTSDAHRLVVVGRLLN